MRLKKIGMLNIIIAIIIVVSWFNVLLIHGQAGAFFWVALIIAYPIMGVFGIVVNLVIIIMKSFKKTFHNKSRSIILCLLCLILIYPGTFFLGIVPFGYPSKVENTSPSITVEWPLRETTVVGWGGDSIEDNYHAIWSGERWAYDLLMEPYDVGSNTLEDYGIWNKEVFAPVSGIVVGAFDGEVDIPPNTVEFLSAEGNYVFIQIEETKTYLLLCHLKQGSVEVQVGDYVQAGDYLGRVGNSGSTSEPHLHIHHQRHDPTKTHIMLAEGLPLYFKTDGDKFMPVKGDVVKSIESSEIKEYNQNEDGSWTYGDRTYQYKLELIGRDRNAIRDGRFVVLTNNENITYEDVSNNFLSSNSEDHLDAEETAVVEMGFE